MSKLVLARVKTIFSLYCSAMQLKTKLVLAHVRTKNSARQMRFFLFSLIFVVLWMPQKKGEPKKVAQKRGKQATIHLPPAGANDPSSDDDNEAGPVAPEGPAGVVRSMEVLAEPLLKVTPEGFTKEVVKLEDGDLTQWPQLSVRIENLLMASDKGGVVHVACTPLGVRCHLCPFASQPRVAHNGRSNNPQAVGFKVGGGCHQDV